MRGGGAPATSKRWWRWGLGSVALHAALITWAHAPRVESAYSYPEAPLWMEIAPAPEPEPEKQPEPAPKPEPAAEKKPEPASRSTKPARRPAQPSLPSLTPSP